MLAVSASRISPTMMTSGSCRTNARSAAPKVESDSWFDLRLVDAAKLVFDGILDREDLACAIVERSVSMVASVVVLPLPVGPVTTTRPCGSLSKACSLSWSSPG